jgi:hypothetical protein
VAYKKSETYLLMVQSDKDYAHRTENEWAYEIKLGSKLICTGQTVKAPITRSYKAVSTMIYSNIRATFNTLNISTRICS